MDIVESVFTGPRQRDWTKKADEVSREVEEALRPIFAKYADSVPGRELAYLVMFTAQEIHLLSILDIEGKDKNG